MKKNKKKHRKRINLFLIIYLFFFFFSPPITAININIVQAIFSLVCLLSYESLKSIRNCMVRSKMYQFLKYFLFLISYMLLTALGSILINPINIDNYINSFYGIFLFSVILMINILFIILRCCKLQFGLEDLLKHCVYAGLIQAVIAIVMLLNLDIYHFLNNIMVKNTGIGLMENELFAQVRGFAFSRNMVDVFGYGVGVMAGISFYFGMEQKRIYLFYFVLLMILIFLNARTGIIIAAIGICVWVLICITESRIRLSKVRKTLFWGMLLVGTIVIAFQFLQELAPATAKWILRDLYGLFQKLGGMEAQGGTVVNVLFSEKFWTLPGILGLIFGTGHNVYGANGYNHSDVGYINLIWQIGIPGMLAMMLIFYNLFWRGIKFGKDKVSRWISVYIALAFYVFNIKGSMLSYTPGSAITMLAIFSTIYFSRIDVMDIIKRKELVKNDGM